VRKLSADSRISKQLIDQLQILAARYGFQLDREQMGAAALPNSIASITCYTWLAIFFRTSGDDEPNVNEIHLDPVEEKDIYKEYVGDLQYHHKEDDIQSYDKFCKVLHLLVVCQRILTSIIRYGELAFLM
jgi:hypothetical protein